jgi:hypothetical protein
VSNRRLATLLFTECETLAEVGRVVMIEFLIQVMLAEGQLQVTEHVKDIMPEEDGCD